MEKSVFTIAEFKEFVRKKAGKQMALIGIQGWLFGQFWAEGIDVHFGDLLLYDPTKNRFTVINNWQLDKLPGIVSS